MIQLQIPYGNHKFYSSSLIIYDENAGNKRLIMLSYPSIRREMNNKSEKKRVKELKIYILNFHREDNRITDQEYAILHNLINKIGLPAIKSYPYYQILCDLSGINCEVAINLSHKHNIKTSTNMFPDLWPTEENSTQFPKLASMIKQLDDDGVWTVIMVCENNYHLPTYLPHDLALEMGLTTDIICNNDYASKLFEIDIHENDEGARVISTTYIDDGFLPTSTG